MRKHVGQIIVVLLLFIANAVVLARIMSQWRGKPEAVEHLPDLSFLDHRQNGIADLPTLIEIVDPRANGASREIASVAKFPIKHDFRWIVFTPEPNVLADAAVSHRTDLNRSQFSDPLIVTMSTQDAKHLFNRGSLGDIWMLYDKEGRLRAEGAAIKGGIVGALAGLVDGAPRFSPHLLQTEISQLLSMGGLRNIQTAEKSSSSEKALVLIISDASSECRISAELAAFDISAKRFPGVAHLVMVPSTWPETKRAAFVTNLDIHTPVIAADARMTTLWEDLDTRFGPLAMNGSLILFTPAGVKAASQLTIHPDTFLATQVHGDA